MITPDFSAGKEYSIITNVKAEKPESPSLLSPPEGAQDCRGEPPQWAPKVPRGKIGRLYATDAQGIIDTYQIDEVGWALWQRCDSILIVTAAHYGNVRCPLCGTVIARPDPWSADEIIQCSGCEWCLPWATYHRSYQGKQLFGANAVDVFAVFHQAFPGEKSAAQKMLLIDQLIHAFHVGLQETGRPVAANLIQGSLGEVIRFLDGLTSSEGSAAGIGASQQAWHRTLVGAEWTRPFLARDDEAEGSQ